MVPFDLHEYRVSYSSYKMDAAQNRKFMTIFIRLQIPIRSSSQMVSTVVWRVEHTASDMAANTEEQTASTWITSFHGLREYKSFGLRS